MLSYKRLLKNGSSVIENWEKPRVGLIKPSRNLIGMRASASLYETNLLRKKKQLLMSPFRKLKSLLLWKNSRWFAVLVPSVVHNMKLWR